MAPITRHVQADLFGLADAALEGFSYAPEAIGPAEEADLVRRLGELTFVPFDFHGYKANRRVVGFGLRYDYGTRAVVEAPTMPDWLTAIRVRVARFAGRSAEDFVQALINEYQPGAGIGWHRDKSQFGEVAALSLLAPCRLRFRRKAGGEWERRTANIEPRSVYLLSGPARGVWQHSVPPLDRRRYSITFRTLARPAGEA